MQYKISTSIVIISFLLCFDSLLKIALGSVYIQVGVFLSIVFMLLSVFDVDYEYKVRIYRKDYTILIFLALVLLHITLAENLSVYLNMLSYYLVFIVLYVYVSESVDFVNLNKLSLICLVTLLITGFTQYILTNYFSIQLELRGVESSYYENNGDLASRMRGLFLEPNWYGLILFSWAYLYIRSQLAYTKCFFVLCALTIVAILLSGNRLIILFSVAMALSVVFKASVNRVSRYLPLVILGVCTLTFIGLSFYGEISDRSAMARLYTLTNVINVMLDSDFWKVMFGYGFSNWGGYSNLLEFSWSNYLFDQALTRRDNSELYVVFFEMGVLGILVFLFDIIFISKNENSDTTDKIYLSFIYVSSLSYPIFTFIFYMMPMMIIRSRVVRGLPWR